MSLTREQIEADAPDVVKAIRAEGAAAECERIKAVQAATLPGHEKLVAQLMYDGKSTAGDAALAINAAEQQLRAAAAKDSADAAPGAVPQAALDKVAAGAPPAADATDEASLKAKWDGDAKLRAEFGEFSTYQAYAKAQAAGQVRVLKSKE